MPQTKTRKQPLLEVVVDDEGKITLVGTETCVNARAIGAPRTVCFVVDPNMDEYHPHTTFSNFISAKAPKRANAYSLCCDKKDLEELDKSDKANLYLDTPIQFFEIGRQNLRQIFGF